MTSHSPLPRVALLLALTLSLAAPVPADDLDAVAGVPFREGVVIGIEDLTRIRDYIPPPFWEHRDYFFFEGMQLRIGPFFADYSPSDLRKEIDRELGGKARIGRDERGEGWLEFYVAGTPFPQIDLRDPDAGLKIAWNATHQHDPMEGAGHFRLATFSRGGMRESLFYQGHFWGLRLANRIDRVAQGGLYFPDEERRSGGKITLEYPSDYRTLAAVGYRYLVGDDRPLSEIARDAWAYIPQLRRVRRFPASTEEDQAIPGTEFLIEDINGFNFRTGVIQKYGFELVGEAEVLTPIDTTLLGFPLDENPNLGPSGFSVANDVWQLRKAWVLDIRKKSAKPVYSRKRLWIDQQTYSSLYAAAYDRRGELWRLIYVVHRWSESPAHKRVSEACDRRGPNRLHHLRKNGSGHPQVEGAERFLYPIGHIVVNVRNGKGSRLEAWDAHATHLRDADIRRNLDSNRLSIGGR
ncbi:MAG: DUF1329 domain-containing protein [Myxococcota bacterium]